MTLAAPLRSASRLLSMAPLPLALLAAACASGGTSASDFLDPPTPAEPLDGLYEFDVEVPNFGSVGGYEDVRGTASFAGEQFEVQSTHGSCAGRLDPDGPGRYRAECASVRLLLEWLGSRWGGRMDVQLMESEDEEICTRRSDGGGCAAFRTERRQVPVRRSAELALYRPGEAR